MTTGTSVLMLHRMTGTVLGDGYYSKRIVCSCIVRKNSYIIPIFHFVKFLYSYIFVPVSEWAAWTSLAEIIAVLCLQSETKL